MQMPMEDIIDLLRVQAAHRVTDKDALNEMDALLAAVDLLRDCEGGE